MVKKYFQACALCLLAQGPVACYSHENSSVADITYTGFADTKVEIVDANLRDAEGVSYKFSQDHNGRLEYLGLETSEKKDVFERACKKKVFFPDLQSIEIMSVKDRAGAVRKRVAVDFSVYADEDIALSEETKFENYRLVIDVIGADFGVATIYKDEKVIEKCSRENLGSDTDGSPQNFDPNQ